MNLLPIGIVVCVITGIGIKMLYDHVRSRITTKKDIISELEDIEKSADPRIRIEIEKVTARIRALL